jgi:hypothetical protein
MPVLMWSCGASRTSQHGSTGTGRGHSRRPRLTAAGRPSGRHDRGTEPAFGAPQGMTGPARSGALSVWPINHPRCTNVRRSVLPWVAAASDERSVQKGCSGALAAVRTLNITVVVTVPDPSDNVVCICRPWSAGQDRYSPSAPFRDSPEGCAHHDGPTRLRCFARFVRTGAVAVDAACPRT